MQIKHKRVILLIRKKRKKKKKRKEGIKDIIKGTKGAMN